MPRQARLDTPGTLHHVMIRGIERKRIFREDEDREDFVSRLRSLSKETREMGSDFAISLFVNFRRVALYRTDHFL